MNSLAEQTRFQIATSQATDAVAAFDELDAQADFRAASAAILFTSPGYDLDTLTKCLNKRVKAPLLCCTTAGEISSQGYTSNGMVAATLRGCQAKLVEFSTDPGDLMWMEDEFASIARDFATEGTDESCVGLLAVDGLCRQEEGVIRTLQSALPTIPIVGGSAGDGLRFSGAHVFSERQFKHNTGSLLVLRGPFVATPFHSSHIVPAPERVVATRVNPAERRLYDLDGKPATHRIAELLGCDASAITVEKLATRSFLLRFGQEYFVRSVQTVHDDGSLSLFCAIHQGDVLHIGKAGEIIDTTGSHFDAMKCGDAKPDLIITFDCILRRLELSMKGKTAAMRSVLQHVPLIGFSTYGEQYAGQHVNQSMTGVALWKK